MPQVILPFGRIGAGKTYFAGLQKQAMTLSCDDLVLTLFTSCQGEQTPAIERRARAFLYEQAVRLIELGVDVVLDGCFGTRAARDEARAFFAAHGIPTAWVYVRTDEEVRRQRIRERNRRLADSPRREYIMDEELLARLDAGFEPPTEDECFTVFENR